MKGKKLFVLGIILIGIGVVFQVTPAEKKIKEVISDTKEKISSSSSPEKNDEKTEESSYKTAFQYQQPEEAMKYEEEKFPENTNGRYSNSVYYSNHNENKELVEATYDMKDYQKYVKWLDWKMYTDPNFRQQYSQTASKKGDYTYMNTGKLLKSSYDYPKLNKEEYDYEITKTEEKNTDLLIYFTLKKAKNYILYEISKEDEFFSLVNEIIQKYVDIPVTAVGSGGKFTSAYVERTSYDVELKNQVNICGNLEGVYTGNSNMVVITMYRAKEL